MTEGIGNHSPIRAAVFDVYNTLMRVEKPAWGEAETAVRWEKLCESCFSGKVDCDFQTFTKNTERTIAERHASAREQGIAFPEIWWPEIVEKSLPHFAKLSAPIQKQFILGHMRIHRSLSLMPGAEKILRGLWQKQILLGIASNSQAYTLDELEEVFTGTSLHLSIFEPDLQFWSFRSGFSKPNPHVFRMLSAALAARGIRPEETIMVGDRTDNDIEPAIKAGWRAWKLEPGDTTNPDCWDGLRKRLNLSN
jgi:FMN phosphatase YigB (HAD superfamily)